MLFIEYHTLTAMNNQDDDVDPLSPLSLEGDAVSFTTSRVAAQHSLKVNDKPQVVGPVLDEEVVTDVFVDCSESNSSSVQIVDSPHQSEVEIVEVEGDVGSKSALIEVCSKHTLQPLSKKSNQPSKNSNFCTEKFPLSDSDDIYSTTSKLRNQKIYFTLNYGDPINLEESVKNDTTSKLRNQQNYYTINYKNPTNLEEPMKNDKNSKLRNQQNYFTIKYRCPTNLEESVKSDTTSKLRNQVFCPTINYRDPLNLEESMKKDTTSKLRNQVFCPTINYRDPLNLEESMKKDTTSKLRNQVFCPTINYRDPLNLEESMKKDTTSKLRNQVSCPMINYRDPLNLEESMKKDTTSKLRNQVFCPTINYRDPLNLEESMKKDAQYLLSSPSEYLNSPTRSPDDFVLPSPQLQSTPKNNAQYLLSSPSKYLNSPTRSPDDFVLPSPQLQSTPKNNHKLLSSPQFNDAATIAENSEQIIREDEQSKNLEHSEHSSTDEGENEKKEDEEDNAPTTLKNSTTTSPPPSSSPDDRSDDLISKTIVELLPQEDDTKDPEISDNIKSYVRLKLLSRPELDSAEASDVTREAITYTLDNDTNDNIGDNISVTNEEIHSEHPQLETNDHSIINNVSIFSISISL